MVAEINCNLCVAQLWQPINLKVSVFSLELSPNCIAGDEAWYTETETLYKLEMALSCGACVMRVEQVMGGKGEGSKRERGAR